jgi:hypothetical protein
MGGMGMDDMPNLDDMDDAGEVDSDDESEWFWSWFSFCVFGILNWHFLFLFVSWRTTWLGRK